MQASVNGDEITFTPNEVETDSANQAQHPQDPPVESATMFRSPEGKYSAVALDQSPQPVNTSDSVDDNLADLHLNDQGGGLPDLTTTATARTWTWSDAGQWVAGHSAEILTTVTHVANVAGTGLSGAAAYTPRPALSTAAAAIPAVGGAVTIAGAVKHLVTLRDGRSGDTPEQNKLISATNGQLYVHSGLMALGGGLGILAAAANATAESHANTLPATTVAAIKTSATVAAGLGTLLAGVHDAAINTAIPTFRAVLPNVQYENASPEQGSVASLSQNQQQPDTFTVAGAAEVGQATLRQRQPHKEQEIFIPRPDASASGQKPRR
ncbi:hypothetical protein BN159_0169 [Streptomyces davaonensis JCM 4913]|uniref:Uncharacterized protein n=1 Tax=Streptomyces davaonensis (strain DSM 101723 / JCM 4913 / KCC S-0913 / 768) TaxID=1214101 RepID=K4QUC1_STRDJ|nr:hypothetical protein [Streptomyces davaonensis]CCK24548.1 hypothetical protein BN159_0169 [Streptomyces davaonensis JCM 4913]